MILLRYQRRDGKVDQMRVITAATAIMQGQQWLDRGTLRSFIVLDGETIVHRCRREVEAGR